VNAPEVLILVTVGTDVHPFDRVVRWVDEWAASHTGVTVFQQIGSSSAPLHTGYAPLVELEELHGLMRRASAVVAHGGPSTIADARRLGRYPIVVPRDPVLGEHIDDHQQRYAAHLEEAGRALVVSNRSDLHAQLDRAITDPDLFRCAPNEAPIEAAVARFATLVEELGAEKRPRPGLRARWLLRKRPGKPEASTSP
jgi:UDP-N-acetylglucosamine transferase subunit ALG13